MGVEGSGSNGTLFSIDAAFEGEYNEFPMAATGFRPKGENDFLFGAEYPDPGILVSTGISSAFGGIAPVSSTLVAGAAENGAEYKESFMAAIGFLPKGE